MIRQGLGQFESLSVRALRDGLEEIATSAVDLSERDERAAEIVDATGDLGLRAFEVESTKRVEVGLVVTPAPAEASASTLACQGFLAASAANSSFPNAVPAIPHPPSAASMRSTQVRAT